MVSQQQILDNNSKLSIIQLSNSEIYGGKYSSQIFNKQKNVSFSQILDKKEKENSKLNISRKSISSMRSFTTSNKNGGQVPFSELSFIRSGSPNSFTKAPRYLDRSQTLDNMPGPSDYILEKSLQLTRKQSPSARFDKSPKKSWIDEKLRSDTGCHSPGPKYEPTKNALSKPTKKTLAQKEKN